MNNAEHHKKRRQHLLQQMPADSILLIPGATMLLRNGPDNVFPFRQNSDLLYLTGFPEPNAILALIPNRAEGEFVLFCAPKKPEEEVWTGIRAGEKGACEQYGADQAFSIDCFDQKLAELLTGRQRIYYPVGQNTDFDQKILNTFQALHTKNRKGVVAPEQLAHSDTLIHPMRVIKCSEEIALMRYANQVASQAHTETMKVCQPGMYEYQLSAHFQFHCQKNGLTEMAYPPIVGGGKNACILHYINNNQALKDGDLVLIDAGGEYHGYASDITRTYPVNGSFTAEQRALYDVVLQAQQKVIELIRPGLAWSALQQHTAQWLTEGLLSLGILQGNLDSLIADRAYTPYYMHLSGHWLGLDVHDAGPYQETPLAPGMVATVEPGLYIPAGSPCDARFWNMGIRIEDDILVTEDGYENLTTTVKQPDDIETIMQGG